MAIRGRKVIVDVERGRTVKGWRPRRLGGGLGGRGYTRAPTRAPSGFAAPAGPGGFGGAFAAASAVRAAVGFGAGSGVVTGEALVEEEEELAIKAAVALGEEVGMVVLPLAVLRTVMVILRLHLTLLPDLVGIAVALAEDTADHLSTEA